MPRKALLLLACLMCAATAHAQTFSDKEVVGKKYRASRDSLRKIEYPYALPIWGEKAVRRGYTLPYSAGVSAQYFGQRSDLVINNLKVGFNGGTMHDLDGIVQFDKAKSRSDGISLRPDVWLLPFLNVYGIFGRSAASTDVGYSLWLPDSSGASHQVVALSTKVDFSATTFGLGITPTIGVLGAWTALDMNFTWTDVPQLSSPAMAFVFDPRIGKLFTLKDPDKNVNFWVGGFRLTLNTGTSGSIPLGDALPISEWQSSVNTAMQAVAARNAELDAWWNSLTPAEQANPVNRARYDSGKALLQRTADFLNSANAAIGNAASSTVEYSLDKRPKDMWNWTVGGQFQLSRSWMFRLEFGGLSSRSHIIAGAQYRFGL